MLLRFPRLARMCAALALALCSILVSAQGGGSGAPRALGQPVAAGDAAAAVAGSGPAVVDGDLIPDLIVGPVSGAIASRVLSGADGTELGSGFPFGVGFAGGVRLAMGDINGDGVPDIVAGMGPGGGLVRIFSGVDAAEIASGYPFGSAFTGGVFVATGDVDGDGRADVVVSQGGGGGLVRAYSADAHLLIHATPFGAGYAGGVTVAAADLTGDGRDDLLVAQAIGDRVMAFDVAAQALIGSATPYGQGFTGGVFVAAGDVNGDGRAEVIVAPGSGAGPVRIFDAVMQSELAQVTPYDSGFTGGVRVASADFDGDGMAEIVTGAGPGGAPLVRVYQGGALTPLASLLAFAPTFTGGVFVAAPTAASGIRFTSANETTFTVGQPGTFTVRAIGTPAVTAIAQTGALPSGVTVTDHGDGSATLAGTPAGPGGTFVLTFTASNGATTPANQSFTLTVQEAPAITSAAAATFGLGGPGSFTVTTTGFPDPTLTSSGVLPDGVTFTPNGDGTATLAGTPAPGSGGTYPLMLTADNGVGAAALQAFVLTVDASPVFTSPDATTFVVGIAGSFAITTTALPPVLTITQMGALPAGVSFADNGDGTAALSGPPAPGTGGSYVLTLTASSGVGSDAVQSFTLTVNEAPAMTSGASTTFTVGTGGTFTITTTGFPVPSISSTGALPGGVTLVDNGDGTATLSGAPDGGAGGSYSLGITATNGVGAPASQVFVLAVEEAATITSAAATTFLVGVAGSFTVTTGGVPAVASIVQGGAPLPTSVTFVDNGDGTGTLSGTPDAGTGGTYAVTFTASNGVGAPAVQSFVLTIHQAPAITSADTESFDVGAASSFSVMSTGFPTPTLSSTGALPDGITFTDNGDGTATLGGTPAAGTAGGYPLTLSAGNGVGSAATQSFTLTVICPAIALSPAAGALPAGTFGAAYTQTFTATGGSGHTFAVTAGTAPPGLTLSSAGALTGSPTNTGTFNFTVTATDSFGCTGLAAYSLVVSPDAQPETFNGGVGHTQYSVGAGTPATPAVVVSGTVLANDAGPGVLMAGPASIATTNGGQVALGSNGTFLYTPAVGFIGPSDTFTYTLTDGNGLTDTAVVTMTLSGLVWYVNNGAGSGGDGRSHMPFNTLSAAQTPSASGSTVFVHTGTGATTGDLALDDSQALFGQGAMFMLNGLTIPAGTRPTLSGTVTLASNTAITAVNFAGSGTALTASVVSFAQPVVIDQVSVTGGTSALSLTNVNATGAGAITISNATFANTSAGEVLIDGGNIPVTLSPTATISSNAGRSVDIQNRTGGAVTFAGAITDTAQGIRLNANGASLISFSGGMALNGSSSTLTATTGGTLAITGTNSIGATTPPTGPALNVTNSTIGAGGLTFQRISATGGTNAIVLSGTGASGGLTITGSSSGLCGGQVTVNPVGVPATVSGPVTGDCTGGTIQNTTGAAIVLTNTANVALTRVWIRNAADDGIQGTNVTGFALTSSLVENNGTSPGHANLDFGNMSSVTPDGLHGSGGIVNSTVRDGFARNLSVRNLDGAPLTSFDVTGTQIASNSTIVQGDDGILVEALGTANMAIDVEGSYFAAHRGDHFQAAGVNSGTLSVNFKNNTLAGGHTTALGQGITINAATGVAFGGYTGTIDYDVDGNTINGAILSAITVNLGTSGAAGTFNGFVRNNVIGTSGVANSGSAQGFGIAVDAHGNGTHTVAVTGNTVRQAFDRAVSVLANDGGGVLNLTVQSNDLGVSSDPLGARESFFLNNGSTSMNVFGEVDHHIVRLDFGGSGSLANTLTHGVGAPDDFRIRQRFESRIEMPGYGGTPFDTSAVVGYIQGRNDGSAGEPGSATAEDAPAVTTDGFFNGIVPLPVPF